MNSIKNIDYYLDGLEIILGKTRNEIILEYWNQSKESIERIIKASSNWNKLVFSHSKFNLESDLDFSGPDYKISYLGLPFWGNYHKNNWTNYPNRFERLIKAIAATTELKLFIIDIK